VSPTPARAPIENRSLTVMPAGRPKPQQCARMAKPATPKVLPTMRDVRTQAVTPPTDPSFTPALARPKKNMPKSTGSFRWCSNRCSGASS